MTRREWALWSVIALVAVLLVWRNEQRTWANCRAHYTVSECAKLLNR